MLFRSASKFSKDVTDRTLQRVKTIVREMQTVHVLKETEETNVHELKNPIASGDSFGSTPHINGVYKCVDKFYLNRIVNYGKRLMLEFQIPEPANFYLFRGIQNKLNNDAFVKPLAPQNVLQNKNFSESGLISVNSLSESNYTLWASYYGATDVEAPPEQYLNFSKSYKSATAPTSGHDGEVFKDEIVVPRGLYCLPNKSSWFSRIK